MKLRKTFLAGIISYLLSSIPFILYYISYSFLKSNKMTIWYIFLLSLVPSALLGMVFFAIGLFQKNKTKQDKIIGIVGLIYGILILIFSIIAFSLLLIVLQSF